MAAQRQRRWRRGEPQAKPNSGDRPKRRKKEDERRITSALLSRCHLVDVRTDDGKVGADADSGDRSRYDKPTVITDERGQNGADTRDHHGHKQKITTTRAIGERAQQQSADDVADQIEKHRQAEVLSRRLRPQLGTVAMQV
jgi:hypothetical protein